MSHDLELSVTDLENSFLRTLLRLNASEKACYYLYIEIQAKLYNTPANDAVFALQTIKKNRTETLKKSTVIYQPKDRIDHLIISLSNAYQKITNDPVGLVNGLTPQKYNDLKSKISRILDN